VRRVDHAALGNADVRLGVAKARPSKDGRYVTLKADPPPKAGRLTPLAEEGASGFGMTMGGAWRNRLSRILIFA